MIRRLRIPQRATILFTALMLMVAGLLATNIGVASAHNWEDYHWDRSGPVIGIRSYIYGNTTAEAEAARVDGWNKIEILYNDRVSTHDNVSVFDGNFGDTGWSGLATLEDRDWDWGCFGWCHIAHGHARYNSYYGGDSAFIQGIYCQEVFHTYGFDHSDTGDCMGWTYYPNSTPYYGPHNNIDFSNRYRNH